MWTTVLGRTRKKTITISSSRVTSFTARLLFAIVLYGLTFIIRYVHTEVVSHSRSVCRGKPRRVIDVSTNLFARDITRARVYIISFLSIHFFPFRADRAFIKRVVLPPCPAPQRRSEMETLGYLASVDRLWPPPPLPLGTAFMFSSQDFGYFFFALSPSSSHTPFHAPVRLVRASCRKRVWTRIHTTTTTMTYYNTACPCVLYSVVVGAESRAHALAHKSLVRRDVTRHPRDI